MTGSRIEMQGMLRRAQCSSSSARSRLINDREEDDAGLALDLAQDPLELARRADKGVDVLEWLIVGIVGRSGAGNGVEGFARRIGNEMHMEVVARRPIHRIIHAVVDGLCRMGDGALGCIEVMHEDSFFIHRSMDGDGRGKESDDIGENAAVDRNPGDEVVESTAYTVH